MTLTSLLERLLIPPGGCLLLVAVGWFLARNRSKKASALQRAGRIMMLLGFLTAWGASLPWVGVMLMRSLETEAAWDPASSHEAQAIVVLGAGVEGETPEYDGLTLGALSLERVRWAARVQSATGLPLAVTGGSVREGSPSVAQLMRDALEQDFAASVQWSEGASATTWENAEMIRQQLHPDKIQRVLLVTHAWHMPRAVMAFKKFGFDVIPAPTMFHGAPPTGINAWIPSSRALRRTSWALHEWLGRVAYSLRQP